MKYRNAQIVNLARVRTRRKLQEIRNALVPDAEGESSAEALARAVGGQLSALPPEGRRRLFLKAAAAAQELGALRDELFEHRTQIAEELRRLRRHQSAAGAYGQSQIRPRTGRR